MNRLSTILIAFSFWNIHAANAAPTVYTTNIAAGASNLQLDYACTCKKFSNAGSKGITVFRRTASEWNAFVAKLAPNVTATNCFTGSNATPTIDIPDLTTSSCKGTSGEGTISSRSAAASRAVVFDLSSTAKTSVMANCQFTLLLNGIQQTLTDGMTVNVCQSDVYQYQVMCNAGHYTGTITLTDSTTSTVIDTSAFDLNSGSGCL